MRIRIRKRMRIRMRAVINEKIRYDNNRTY